MQGKADETEYLLQRLGATVGGISPKRKETIFHWKFVPVESMVGAIAGQTRIREPKAAPDR